MNRAEQNRRRVFNVIRNLFLDPISERHCDPESHSASPAPTGSLTSQTQWFSLSSSGRRVRLAFTLAEVLITLGIIGIVAEMTIPTLMNNVQDQAFKAAWKKEYSAYAQVYEQIKQDEGGTLDSYFDGVTNGIAAPLLVKFKDYVSVYDNCNYSSVVCGTNPGVTLLTNNVYKTLSGGYVDYNNFVMDKYVLKDGANVYTRSYNPTYAHIWIDVNGYAKKPNKLGKDLLGMVITKDKILPMGALGTGVEDTCNSAEVTCPGSYGFHGSVSCAGAGCANDYLYK